IKFSWKPSPFSTLGWPGANLPVAKVLQDPELSGKTYTDYVSYTVTLTFQNKSRTYKTWMLYGKDEKGKPQVYFMDMVADPTAVLFAFEHSLYPAAFTESNLRTVPFVDKWLYDNARSCSAKSEKDNDRIDVCCDPGEGRCGVPQSSLAPRTSGKRTSTQKSAKTVPASFNVSILPIYPLMQAPGGFGQSSPPKQPMSHEEEVVRTTYGRLSFAAQIGMLWHATEQHEGWPGLNDALALTKAMNDQVRFDISGVKTGELMDIANES